jgi:glycosyltransferase involved in cell wall biosynthesis
MNDSTPALDAFISVIAPLRDASRHVEEIILEIDRTVRGLARHYEIVLVDDASRDDTVEIVQRIQKKVENIQLYCLNRRSGLDVALVAGLDNSIGDFVITLNVERDPIALIPMLWEKALQGNEAVCGVRKDWSGGGLHARANRMFYAAFESTTGLRVPAGLSDLRLYSRRIVGYITQNNDRHLLLRVLPYFASHRVVTLEYEPLKRGDGFGPRSWPDALLAGLTILLASSIRPLRLLTLMALVASSLSLLYAVYVLGVALLKKHVVEGWESLALPMAVMFFFIFTILGILSEYIYMLSQQSGNRPVYSIVKESASSALEIERKLNIVDGEGDFANRQ